MTQNTQKPGDKSNTKTQNPWTTTAGGQTGTGKDTDKSRKQTTKGEWQEGPTSWNASPAGQGKSGSVNKNK
jgi:hypothetical protein